MKSKAPTPTLFHPVRGSRTGRPIMVALDLLGRRGALRIIWELRGGIPMTFRALQEAAETNPSLLNTRLAELRAAALIVHDGHGYLLAPQGLALLRALGPLSDWAVHWAARKGTRVDRGTPSGA